MQSRVSVSRYVGHVRFSFFACACCVGWGVLSLVHVVSAYRPCWRAGGSHCGTFPFSLLVSPAGALLCTCCCRMHLLALWTRHASFSCVFAGSGVLAVSLLRVDGVLFCGVVPWDGFFGGDAVGLGMQSRVSVSRYVGHVPYSDLSEDVSAESLKGAPEHQVQQLIVSRRDSTPF
jgi:hypothetical protein